MIRALFSLIALPFRLFFGLAHGLIGLVVGLLALVFGLIRGLFWLILLGIIFSVVGGIFNRKKA